MTEEKSKDLTPVLELNKNNNDIEELQGLVSALSLKNCSVENLSGGEAAETNSVKNDLAQDEKEESKTLSIEVHNEESETSVEIVTEENVVTEENDDLSKTDPASSEIKDEKENSVTKSVSELEGKQDSSGEDSDSENSEVTNTDNEDSVSNKGVSSNLEPVGETSEEEEEEDESKYLKRGLTDQESDPTYFYPLAPNNQQQNFFVPPTCENVNSSPVFDFLEFQQSPSCETFPDGYNAIQSNMDGYTNDNQLSSESARNVSSPFCTSNFPLNFNPDSFGYQTEMIFNDNDESGGPMTLHTNDSSSYDFGNNGFESFQPLSPPHSISPFMKDEIDTTPCTVFDENLKESEDLIISIINTLNKTSKTEPQGFPETEFFKLRNVLEGNEASIRDEMAIYLKDEETRFQPTLSTMEESPLNDSNVNFPSFEGPLTPPKSVSPVQDGLSYKSFFPVSNYNSEEHLIDMLNGIHEINPEEFTMYLNEEKNVCDPSYARNIIQARCKPNSLDHALRRLSSKSAKFLCKKDEDGDTCLMIVYSKPEDSPEFYENIFCLQEKVREIRLCCDVPLGKAKRCKICGMTNASKFYTPLSLKNKQGDTALSCALKTEHSEDIINYILHAILQCEEDFRRIFDEKGRSMLADISYKYPSLRQYIMK